MELTLVYGLVVRSEGERRMDHRLQAAEPLVSCNLCIDPWVQSMRKMKQPRQHEVTVQSPWEGRFPLSNRCETPPSMSVSVEDILIPTSRFLHKTQDDVSAGHNLTFNL